VAREKDGAYVPVIKISGNPEKVSTPGGLGVEDGMHSQISAALIPG